MHNDSMPGRRQVGACHAPGDADDCWNGRNAMAPEAAVLSSSCAAALAAEAPVGRFRRLPLSLSWLTVGRVERRSQPASDRVSRSLPVIAEARVHTMLSCLNRSLTCPPITRSCCGTAHVGTLPAAESACCGPWLLRALAPAAAVACTFKAAPAENCTHAAVPLSPEPSRSCCRGLASPG